ncbi:hypothetical protein [Microcoleus sp. Pol8_D1]
MNFPFYEATISLLVMAEATVNTRSNNPIGARARGIGDIANAACRRLS